jgi:hypothetical protein
LLGTVEKPRIVVKAFSSEKSLKNEKEEVLETVLFSLGVEKDLNEFYDSANNNAVLRKTVSDLYGMRLTSPPDLFSLVILAITLQRASYGRTEKNGEGIMRKLWYPCKI